MRTAGVVADEVIVEHDLHLLDCFEACSTPLDPEVLVVQGSFESFYIAVRLRAFHARRPVRDVLALKEQLVGVLVGTPTE